MQRTRALARRHGPAVTDSAASQQGKASVSPPGGLGSANSSLQASADFGALRSRGSVAATGVGARGSAGLEMAGAPTTVALFDNQVLVGGVGTQLFEPHYALTGTAGHIGPGQMQFAAALGLQASGAGVSIVSAPPPIGISLSPPFIDTYGFAVSGTAPRAIGLGDFLVTSAAGGIDDAPDRCAGRQPARRQRRWRR